MFISKLLRNFFVLLFFFTGSLSARDILLEFKGAYFLATEHLFREIYGNGGALYGPEVTFQLCDDDNWYGFASIDFFQKDGHSLGLCDATKARIMPLALGLKYFVPFCYGDFYIGLGFQPTHLKTINCSPFVAECTSQWGFGGIAKIGTYFDLPCNFLIDIFIDYSFVKVDCNKKCQPPAGPVTSTKADISGVIFGAGLGYRFN